jgi:hypothetical protein
MGRDPIEEEEGREVPGSSCRKRAYGAEERSKTEELDLVEHVRLLFLM